MPFTIKGYPCSSRISRGRGGYPKKHLYTTNTLDRESNSQKNTSKLILLSVRGTADRKAQLWNFQCCSPQLYNKETYRLIIEMQTSAKEVAVVLLHPIGYTVCSESVRRQPMRRLRQWRKKNHWIPCQSRCLFVVFKHWYKGVLKSLVNTDWN